MTMKLTSLQKKKLKNLKNHYQVCLSMQWYGQLGVLQTWKEERNTIRKSEN